MGRTPGSAQPVQRSTQSNTQALRWAIRLVQMVDVSELQLPSSHFTPHSSQVVCVQITFAVRDKR